MGQLQAQPRSKDISRGAAPLGLRPIHPGVFFAKRYRTGSSFRAARFCLWFCASLVWPQRRLALVIDAACLRKYQICMGYRLSAIPNRYFSLEFEMADMPAVAEAIKKRYGSPEEKRHIMCIEYFFGGSHFVFQDDWDDPCLISTSNEGAKILKLIFADLAVTAQTSE